MARRTNKQAHNFYEDVLRRLLESSIPFMVGGAYALREYADIFRDTKDLDLFCLPGDYSRILEVFRDTEYTTEIKDPDWLAKVQEREHLIDVIFAMGNRLFAVDETWLEHAPSVTVFGHTVKLIPPEEMVWSKIYVQERERYDGADVNHIIRKRGKELDWKRIHERMDAHWELLFSAIMNYWFVYPTERDHVPDWLVRELVSRVQRQLTMPLPRDRVCRGPVVAYYQYRHDIVEWGYRW